MYGSGAPAAFPPHMLFGAGGGGGIQQQLGPGGERRKSLVAKSRMQPQQQSYANAGYVRTGCVRTQPAARERPASRTHWCLSVRAHLLRDLRGSLLLPLPCVWCSFGARGGGVQLVASNVHPKTSDPSLRRFVEALLSQPGNVLSGEENRHRKQPGMPRQFSSRLMCGWCCWCDFTVLQ